MTAKVEPVKFLSSRAPSAEYSPLLTRNAVEYEIAPLLSNASARWKQWVLRLAPLTCSAALLCQWLYFVMRLKYAIKAGMSGTSVFLCIVITAEFLASLPTLLSYPIKAFCGWQRPRPSMRLLGDYAPSVDVIITYCGEPLGILVDTTRAACVLDYPTDCFRVIVSDDAASSELCKAVGDIAAEYPNLIYTARKIGKNHGYKAGNLNHGLRLGEELPGGPSEYIASLDCDMIPQPDWLRALVPHLILDARVAMVSPPQLYYNIPPNDPLQQSLIPFFGFMEPLKQWLAVAWCTGSGYVMRRQALEDIGGFPTYSIAEDVYTSSLMLGAGWKTVYVDEPLQHGLMPDSLSAHLKQRTRWNIGGLQTAEKMRFCLFGKNARHMKIWQRISGFLFPSMIISNALITVSLVAIPLALLLDFPLIGYTTHVELRQLLALAALAYGSVLLNEVVLSVEVGFRNAMREIQATHWMAPYYFVALIRSFVLPAWLGGRTAVFDASGSLAGGHERDPNLRATFVRRVPAMILDNQLWIHISLMVANVAGAVLCITRAQNRFKGDPQARNEYMLVRLGWPPLLWLVFTLVCAGPIYYAIFPPSMPAREETLDRDPLTNVAYPKPTARKLKWTWTTLGYEYYYTVVVAYTVGILLGSESSTFQH